MQTQAARLMSVNEKTLCLSFEIRMPHSSGLLNLAFPAVVSNTILRRLTSDWSRHRRHTPESRKRMESLVRRVQMGATLQLPSVRLAAHAVETLEPGTLIALWPLGQHPCGVARGRSATGLGARDPTLMSAARRTSESVVGVDQ